MKSSEKSGKRASLSWLKKVFKRVKMLFENVISRLQANGNGNKAMEDLLQARLIYIEKAARKIDRQAKKITPPDEAKAKHDPA